ncbi:MAG: glycosyltransferase family 39 protein [Gammaproteobacteria bacterium]|nr:MAG: glycosyltransferase family 39 protein [Gammaproteobacteria bacterium]
MKAQRREWLWLLLCAFVILAAGIGLRDPWPADEPRFALSAQQMVQSGDWLIPHRGHEIYADKPPAFMIAQAASYEITRSWRVAFLLPSLLAALGTLWLIYDLARRLWDQRTGLYAAGALLIAFQFVYQAKRAQIDPAVTFFITLANYGLLRHFLLGPNWRMYWLGCFAAGLGVITKGVGVLALFLFVPYIFARFAHWNFVAPTSRCAMRWLGGALAFLAALGLWFVPLFLAVRADPKPEYAAYLHDILVRQTAARYTDSWDHQHPFWYYVGVIATGWLPLLLALPWLLPRWRDALRARDARLLLPLVWIVLIVLFFSLPRGKRDVYILPALPLFALAAAPFLHEIVQRVWARRTALALTCLIGAGFLGAGAYFLFTHPLFARDLATQRGLANQGAALWWLLIALGAWMLGCAAYFRNARAVHGLVAGVAGLWLLWSFWAYPLLNDSSSAAGLMRHAGAMVGADAELGLVAWKEQNLLFADREVAEFGFVKPAHEQLGEAIVWQRTAPQRRWVLVLADAMTPCIERVQAQYVGHANRREWWLFRADAVAPACREGKVPAPKDSEAVDPNAE